MLKHTPAAILAFAVFVAVSPIAAQDVGRCVTPDTITVSGNSRVPASTILLDAGIVPGVALNAPSLRRAINSVFQSGQFESVDVTCTVADVPATRVTLTVVVIERPLLDFVDLTGPKAVALNDVKDRVDMLNGRPVDPAQVARIIQRIDSLYFAKGYPLVRVKVDTTRSADNHASIVFRVDEGRRLAISGIRIEGNKLVSAKQIAAAMKTKREGFFFWQAGELDKEKYAQDLGERIPELYSARGFIDFQLIQDTLIVDRERGKALISLKIKEGPQYRVGSFEVVGNKRFNSEDIARYYPFGTQTRSLADRVKSIVVKGTPVGVFNQAAWDQATSKTREAYANEGYIYAEVRPVMDRQPNDPTGAKVNLRWDITEKTPAIINRVDIVGNDFTVETCIRDQLSIIPGQVFNQDALIRSYQSIGNLGFFETPLPLPETRPAGDQGDVDVVFKVKEKRTGNVNFGASMGQGTGLGGFIGLEQPNLFGKCKKGSLNWQYGRYINDFSLSYTDPALRQTRYSLTVTGYRSQSRYTIADLGQTTRTGGSVRIAFPFLSSRSTRVGVSYGAEQVRYGGDGLLGTITTNNCAGCLRSTLGVDITRDTRIEMPFPTAGTLQTLNSQFNGGPLGGSASFQRYTTEFKTFTTLASFGGGKPGSSPIKLVAGLSQRAGVVVGNAGPFFSSQEFALGGTQYGESLRGYPEFSITPLGFDPSTSTSNATINSFGSTFFAATAEIGVRVSSSFYANVFYDAGNLWAHPRDFNPTRLFRGAGIGAAIISPLGPLGLDWAYGFDRVDQFGQPAPKWQVHFKLGQFFY